VAWITTTTLLARYNLAAQLVYGQGPGGRKGPMARMKRRPQTDAQEDPRANPDRLATPSDRASQDSLLAALQKRLLITPLKPRQEQALRDYLSSQAELDDGDILETVRLMMSTPEFQVT
jgi:hypothetical protein